jgi:hypothetical protein
MVYFDGHLGRNKGKAEALRQAQLDVLNFGAPPYFLAGFELDGEPSGSPFSQSRTDSFQRRNVCSLIPALRITSTTETPISACFSTATICSTLNRFFFISKKSSAFYRLDSCRRLRLKMVQR